MSDLTIPASSSGALAATNLLERAADYAASAQADNTTRAYQADWRDFVAWCEVREIEPLPAAPETLALYLTHLVDEQALKVSTVRRRLTTIRRAHAHAGLPSPIAEPVRQVMKGISRRHGTAPQPVAPVLTRELRAMLEALGVERAIDVRDRALLLVGFMGALRRSELVALDVADLEFREEGLVLTLRRSKTDQDGEGRRIGLPRGIAAQTCVRHALRRWLELTGIDEGPVFRPVDRHGNVKPHRLGDRAVAEVVKRTAATVGLDPERLAGHSLRSGFATSAAAAGVSERAIMRQTGHKSLPVLRRYIREGRLFDDNPAAKLGL